MATPEERTRAILNTPATDDPLLTGTWSVYRQSTDGTRELIESDLPEEIARQLVTDHEAEGETGYVAVNEE